MSSCVIDGRDRGDTQQSVPSATPGQSCSKALPNDEQEHVRSIVDSVCEATRLKATAIMLTEETQCEAEAFPIFVKLPAGNILTLAVQEAAPVCHLERMICEQGNISLHRQRLTYEGKSLEGEFALFHYGIQKGAWLHCKPRLLGGMRGSFPAGGGSPTPPPIRSPRASRKISDPADIAAIGTAAQNTSSPRLAPSSIPVRAGRLSSLRTQSKETTSEPARELFLGGSTLAPVPRPDSARPQSPRPQPASGGASPATTPGGDSAVAEAWGLSVTALARSAQQPAASPPTPPIRPRSASNRHHFLSNESTEIAEGRCGTSSAPVRPAAPRRLASKDLEDNASAFSPASPARRQKYLEDSASAGSPASPARSPSPRPSGLCQAERPAELGEVAAQLQHLRQHFSGMGKPPPQTAGLQQDNDPEWKLAEWLASIQCTSVLAEALRVKEIAKNTKSDLHLLRALAVHGSKDLVLCLLREGKVLEKLAGVIWNQVASVGEDDAAAGSETQKRFFQDTANFDIPAGQLPRELQALIGPPQAKVQDAMHDEHCEGNDSSIPWTTEGSYGITTTSQIEWAFVVKPEDGPEQLGLREWPKENKLLEAGKADKCRRPRTLRHFEGAASEVNRQLEGLGEEELLHEEIIGVRLYTGPMYEKYNGAIRSRAFAAAKQSHNIFTGLHEGIFCTTVHIINSAILKLSRLQKVGKVYRGIAGGLLPKAFWRKNAAGVCGGIELGFLSSTENLRGAVAGTKDPLGRAAAVFEIQTGRGDRGADFSRFSQYPDQKEVCFAPLTCIEVQGTRVDKQVLIVQARLSGNLKAQTIKQVNSKRRDWVADLCASFELETAMHMYQGPQMDRLLIEEDLMAGEVSFQRYIKKLFQQVWMQEPEFFNDNSQLRQSIDRALAIKDCCFVDAAALQKLCNRGAEAAACFAIIAKRLTSPEAAIFKLASESVKQIQVRTSDAEVIQAVLARMKDNTIDTRLCSVEVLGVIAQKGDQEAIGALIAPLQDPQATASFAAAIAYAAIADEDDRKAIDVVLVWLKDESANVRIRAVKTLGHMGLIRDSQVCDVLVARLRDIPAVRAAAVEVLVGMAEAGDQQACRAILARLDLESEFRLRVVESLVKLSGTVDRQSCEALVARLQDNCTEVCAAASIALRTLVEQGDKNTCDTLVTQENVAPDFVLLAINAMGRAKGDRQTCDALLGLLQDKSPDVRDSAVVALTEVAEKGDQQACDALVALLQNGSLCIRASAVDALGAVAQQGDRRAIGALVARMQDTSYEVRKSAAIAFRTVAEKGNRKAIGSLLVAMQDTFSIVRSTALETIRQVASKGDQRVVDVLAGQLRDRDPIIRTKSAEVLAEVADLGDRHCIDALVGMLREKDEDACICAAQSLAVVGKLQVTPVDDALRMAMPASGNQQAIHALVSRLQDDNPLVRLHSSQALGEIVGPGDQRAVKALIARLQDAAACVRRRAVEALGTINRRSPQQAVGMLRPMMSLSLDPDPDVRAAVTVALEGSG